VGGNCDVVGGVEFSSVPEQEMPDHTLDYPWESCITMTPSWCSTSVNEVVRPTHEIIHTLVSIVSRGGNYLLGIGPDATGAMSKHIVAGLAEVGAWMDINSEAIYETEPGEASLTADPAAGIEWRYTRTTTTSYAIGLLGSADHAPAQELNISTPFTVAEVKLLGSHETLDWHPCDDGIRISLPRIDARFAFTLALTPATGQDLMGAVA
jgi:alpha-L-fucosidase